MTWACQVCTFENENDDFLACAACGSERSTTIEWDPFGNRPGSPEAQGTTHARAPKKPTRAAPKLAPPQSPIHEPGLQKNGAKVGSGSMLGKGTGSESSTAPSDPLKPIFMELVETERIYVKELQAVCTVYLEPLKCRAQETDNPLINESEVNLIFGNINEIRRVNEELLLSFDKSLKDTAKLSSEKQVEAVCKAFLTYAPHLKMYAAYAIQYDTAQTKLKAFESDRFRFAEFINIAGAMNEVTMNQPLSSFLIKPIQRICKYPLFFNQMMKAVKEDSVLQDFFRKAFDAASDVASKINADKLRAEQAHRAFEVAKRLENLGDIVLEPGRRYVGEWKCFVSEGSNSLSMKRRSMAKTMITAEKKARTCFLFNDVLIITKEIGTGTKLRYELKLWMSMDQLQFAGVNLNDPRTAARDTSSGPSQQENGRVPLANGGGGGGGGAKGGDQTDRSVKAKLFQLPLDVLHVANTDREKTLAYRDRQQQAQASQIEKIAARRSSLFAKKKPFTPSASPPAETIITTYTIWFRSGAERARVATLLEKTLEVFTEKNQVSPTKRNSNRSQQPMLSPTRGDNMGRPFFASSEESLPSMATPESPMNAKQQIAPLHPIRRAQSMDSGMDDSKQRRASSTTGFAPPPPPPAPTNPTSYSLDPLHSQSPPKPEVAGPASNSAVVAAGVTGTHPLLGSAKSSPASAPPFLGSKRDSIRNKPRPPAPGLPSTPSLSQAVVVQPVARTPNPPSVAARSQVPQPSPYLKFNDQVKQRPLGMPPSTPVNTAPDELISKWFGE